MKILPNNHAFEQFNWNTETYVIQEMEYLKVRWSAAYLQRSIMINPHVAHMWNPSMDSNSRVASKYNRNRPCFPQKHAGDLQTQMLCVLIGMLEFSMDFSKSCAFVWYIDCHASTLMADACWVSRKDSSPYKASCFF